MLSSIYIFVALYTFYARQQGFYDAFFPTSCVSPTFVLNSLSEVALHARMYWIHYPLSLIINLVLEEILATSCWNLNMFLYVLPFLQLLFFHTLLSYFVQEFRSKILLLIPYSIVLITFLGSSFPIFYISLGDTTYLIILYFLTIVSKRGLRTSEYIILLLFFFLGMFSYYTFGFSIVLTGIIFLLLFIVGYKHLQEKVPQITYFLAVIFITYLGFDYIFYAQMSLFENISYSFVDIIALIFSRLLNFPSSENSLLYITPLNWVLLLYRVAVAFVLISCLIFVLKVISIILKSASMPRYPAKILPKLIVASFIISVLFVSIIYTLLMHRVYIRYYIYFLLILVAAIVRACAVREKYSFSKFSVLIYTSIIILTIYGAVASVYNPFNSNLIFSQFTGYLSEEEYLAICNYLNCISNRFIIYADYKTAYTLPLKCESPAITTRIFKPSFFSIFNNTHNILRYVDKGIVFYSLRYLSSPILLYNWVIYKPFFVQSDSYNGLIFNSGFASLFFKQD